MLFKFMKNIKQNSRFKSIREGLRQEQNKLFHSEALQQIAQEDGSSKCTRASCSLIVGCQEPCPVPQLAGQRPPPRAQTTVPSKESRQARVGSSRQHYLGGPDDAAGPRSSLEAGTDWDQEGIWPSKVWLCLEPGIPALLGQGLTAPGQAEIKVPSPRAGMRAVPREAGQDHQGH